MIQGRVVRRLRRSLLLVAALWWCRTVRATPAGDPYAVLGVSRGDSDGAIRKRYLKLCLRYHPDKQIDKPLRERQRLEERFKQVQEAYARIGRAGGRRAYDASAAAREWPPWTPQPDGYHPGGGEVPDFFTRRYRGETFGSRGHQSYTPLFRGFPSPPGCMNIFATSPAFGKSVFRERVVVSLAALYGSGAGTRHTHTLRVGLWHRIVAALRGGLAVPLLYTSLLYALPVLRLGGRLPALALWLGLFAAQLPAPAGATLKVPLRPGYKEGTRFIFRPGPWVEVVLILQYEKHPDYFLLNHQLHALLAVSLKEAGAGCRKRLRRLSDGNPTALVVTVPPGSRHGDSIVVPSEGWPIDRDRSRFGDLIVLLVVDDPYTMHSNG